MPKAAAWLGVLLLGVYWRWRDLTGPSLWNDEGSSLALIRRDWGGLLEAVSVDIHPPGYYALLKLWVGLAGDSELGLRSLSLFWGVLAVAGTYALGTRLYGRAAGILAALIVALHPLAIYYSQEARMYAQLGTLSILGMYLMARLLTAPRHRTALALGLVLVNTLGLYTHYTYPFSLAAQGLLMAWGLQEKRAPWSEWGTYAAAGLLSLALFAPWLPTAYEQIRAWPSDDDGSSLPDRALNVAAVLSYGSGDFPLGALQITVAILLAMSLFLPDWYPVKPGNAWRAGLPLLWLLFICGAVLFSGAYREANLKFLLPAQIGLALIWGRGLYLLWAVGSSSPAVPLEMAPRFLAALGAGVLLTGLWSYAADLRAYPAFQRDDYRGLVAQIEANLGPRQAIILNAGGQQDVFRYYYTGPAPVYPLPRAYGGDDAALAAETQALVDGYSRLWVVFWGEGEQDPKGVVKRVLDEGAYELGSDWYGGARLAQYAVLEAPPPSPSQALDVRFGEGLLLEGYHLSGEVLAGLDQKQVLGVTLYWRAEQALPARYKISVQWLAAGRAIPLGQHDSEPANNRRPTDGWGIGEAVADNHGLLLPPDLGPGEYQLAVVVYLADNPNERLKTIQGDAWILERFFLP